MRTRKNFKIAGFLMGLAGLCSLLFISSCGEKSVVQEPPNREAYIIPDSLLRTIKIDSVAQTDEVSVTVLYGQVDYNQDNVANVYPLISGKIDSIKVDLGDYVKEGQSLGMVKSPEMAQYSSDVLDAETNLRLAEANLQKTIDLYKGGLASLPDSINAEITVQQARAELTRAKRVLQINGNSESGEYTVKSPISGFIVQKQVTNDMAIRTDNGNSLYTISDLKNVWVWANVYKSNIDKIYQGEDVDITTLSYPGRVFKGKVDKIMSILDPNTKVMKVRVVINNADYALKPQMFASVIVRRDEHKTALSIPSTALVFDHSQYYILVYHGNGRADIRQVQKIGTFEDRTYINGNVNIGDKVIASMALQIYDQLNN